MENMLFNIVGDLLYGGILFLLGVMAQFIRSERKDRRAIENGLCALLRNSIIRIHGEVTEKGEVTATQWENAEKMYEAYHELGGNGLASKMMGEIAAMHTKTIPRDS